MSKKNIKPVTKSGKKEVRPRQSMPRRPSLPAIVYPDEYDSWSSEQKAEYQVQHQMKHDAAITEYFTALQNSNLNRAKQKVHNFVNECVGDPLFRHPDCAVLLQFLIGMRDSLIEGITKEWSMTDILHPIVEDYRPIIAAEGARKALESKLEKLGDVRNYVIGVWVSKPRKRGEKEGFCREIVEEAIRRAGRKIAIKTIRDNWLSSESISAWEENKVTGK